MRAFRRKTAEHLSAAVSTMPHVTQFEISRIHALEECDKYARR